MLTFNNLNLTGGLSAAAVPVENGSIYFNGVSDYLYSSSTDFNLATNNLDFTLEFWFYSTDLTKGRLPLINKGWSENSTNSSYGIYLVEPTGYVRWMFGDGGAGGVYFDASSYPITANTWYHVALVRNSNAGHCYLNGVLLNTLAIGTFGDSGADFTIGTQSSGTAYDFFKGYISNPRLVKGVTVYGKGFDAPTTALTAITNTTLLLATASPDGYLTDSSTNNFTFTNNNGVAYDARSPISTGGSLSFNGTNQYLSRASNTAFDQNGVFTWEAWIYPTNINSGYVWSELNYGYLGLAIGSGGLPGKLYVDMSYIGVQITSGSTITANAWYHVALVYDGTNTRLFLNGSIEGSFAGGGSASGGPLWIGNYNNGPNYFSGYISNFRIVKGTALYNANFIPPNQPLAPAQSANVNGSLSSAIPLANTVLLMNTYNEPFYRQDYSANNRVLSVAGLPGRSSVNPFYTNGSLYFNGASYLTVVPNNNNLNLGTGDFTIESWVYPTTVGADMFVISSSGSGGLFVGWNATGYGWGRTAVAWDYQYAGTKTPNVWQHIALTRSGTAMKFFINGIQAGATQTLSTAYNLTTGSTTIGSQGAQYYWNGYITNLRVVKGTAVYTANFIPSINILPSTQSANVYGSPSAAIPSGNTVLLMNTGGLALLDSSPQYNSITNTAGYVTANTVYQPFYTNGSLYFNGSSQYLSIPSTASLAFGTGDFTVEAWVYLKAIPSDTPPILYAGNFYFNFRGYAGAKLAITDATTEYAVSPFNVPTESWIHVAAVRQSGMTYVFVDGVRGTGVAFSGSFTQGTALIGGDTDTSSWLNGHISNMRVVKGLAVYTDNFVPPIINLPAVQSANVYGSLSAAIPAGNTSLLLNTGGLALLDSSLQYNRVDVPGSVSANTLTPPGPPFTTRTVEYLVVAGGGGGGGSPSDYAGGGGGGAGGYRTANGFIVSPGTPITVTVGAGGTGGVALVGANGQPSVFSTITSLGGGGGAGSGAGTARAGGSGGGGSYTSTSGGVGTAGPPRQGYDGGTGNITSDAGGGGGGSSAVGGNASTGSYSISPLGGDGGAGTPSSISGSSVTYAGGGGGGTYGAGAAGPGRLPGAGGTGGGGGGGPITTYNGIDGTINTGGGGGGGTAKAAATSTGGTGGSGIVIIRYPDGYKAATSTTGSPNVIVASGYRTYIWTTSGSITF